jgi:diguanylate cyclase (GGDEF)-like protein
MVATTTSEQVGAGVSSPRRRVNLLTAVILVPLVLVIAPLFEGAVPFCDKGPWVFVLITAGFVICEPLVFHIEARNEAVSFSPTDLPLAIGLLMLSPLSLVAARIIGSAILLIGWRRQPLFKFTLNLTAFTTETLVAIAVFRAAFQPGDTASLAMWVWLIVSLMVGLVAGGVIIATAISAFEGDFAERIRKEFSYAYLFYLPGAVLGASATIPMLIEPWLLIVVLLPAPIMWLVLRSHASLMHRYTDLSHVFDFSSQVGRSAHLAEIAETAVGTIAEQLRARSVALLVWDQGAGAVRTVHGDPALLDGLPADPGAPSWGLPEGTDIQLVSDDSDGALAGRLRALGVTQAMVATLFGDGEPIGLVVVADRHGATSEFSPDDVARLRKMTEQLGVAVRKGQLHVQIQHDATHDRLTGLPNRPYFEAWSDQIVCSEAASILMIDLDRFKEVNDTLGHHAGDNLLHQVATRLQDSLADSDFPARFGGDEFAVLVPGAGEHEASLLAETISQALERPFELGGSTVAIAASIGIATAPDHGRNAASLLRRADLAMYDAKRRHNRSSVYRPSLDGRDSVRLAMLGDLRDALRNGGLDVEFQPKSDLRSGVVVGVEALARWVHPVHGSVSPDVFVPLAEQAGLIEEMTEHMITRSLDAVARWRDLGIELSVSVNLSPVSLVNEALPGVVAKELEAASVPPHLLILEITEQSVIGDTPRTMRILQQLARIGVRISIDDFGTGHSSLTNLRRLPISELKVDRSFVTEMLVEHNDEVIVRSTIDLGHNLGFTVVAEGVETADLTHRLQSLGCDLAQGYGICRPLPFEKLTTWLVRARTPSVAGDEEEETSVGDAEALNLR